MLVSWRQTNRSAPTSPSRGPTIGSAGSSDSMWSLGRARSDDRDIAADHRPQLQHPGVPDAGDHEHADPDEQHAPRDVDGADVAAEECDRPRGPPEAEGDEEEGDAEPESVREPEGRPVPRGSAVEADAEDRGEGGADAGGPADREDGAEDRRSRQPGDRLPARPDGPLEDAEAAGEDESEGDHHDARDPGEQV